MRVGYVRCSTIEQNEARQLKMMEEQKAEKLFIDKASGKNTDRKAFKEMMAFVRAGDMVIVESISRIARNTRDLLSIVSELTEKQVEFVSLKENIDTTTPQGRFMLTVFGALAELERENIRRSGGTGTGEHLGAATGRNRNRQGRGQVQGPQALGGGRGAIQRRLQAVEGRGDNGYRRHAGGWLEAEHLLQTGQRNGPLMTHQKDTILCATC